MFGSAVQTFLTSLLQPPSQYEWNQMSVRSASISGSSEDGALGESASKETIFLGSTAGWGRSWPVLAFAKGRSFQLSSLACDKAFGLELNNDKTEPSMPGPVAEAAGERMAGCHSASSSMATAASAALAAFFLGSAAFVASCLGALQPAARTKAEGCSQDAVMGVLIGSLVPLLFVLVVEFWCSEVFNCAPVLDFCIPSKTAALGPDFVEFSPVTK